MKDGEIKEVKIFVENGQIRMSILRDIGGRIVETISHNILQKNAIMAIQKLFKQERRKK